MKEEERVKLRRAIEEIMEIARGFGLDFFPMRYEIVPADILYTFGAYGMPTRFSHWSFGKAFHRMKLQYDLGLSKIYELIINSDPSYAFLLEGNSLIQNKLIVAHVLAHSDFFKNNLRFRNTNRQMVESMAASAERIRRYEIQYGRKRVEEFLDAAISIQEHVDPSLTTPRLSWKDVPLEEPKKERKRRSPYEDLWGLDETEKKEAESPFPLVRAKIPPKPEKDLVLFIEEFSSVLEPWQRDILTILHDEMLYFWPQLETKIMNEGWASYWHQRILREMDLTEAETIEYAKLNAGVVQPSLHHLNPYHLGLKIYEDIERRWDHPSEEERRRFHRLPGKGRQKIFEVRELDSDLSFLRNYLTKDLVEEMDLYIYAKQGSEWTITDKNWENVRDLLVASRVNGGFPYIAVEDGDYNRNGELLLAHYYEDLELDVKYIEKTLPYVYTLWGRPVHLITVIENKEVLFTYDGKKNSRKFY
ncbi:involved in spore cortex synthesis (stage V sporulation) [[Clostridium] ultunense Esp]|nr:involved in spore cortex synthesis (stage V sporulation) [[Clostridium] ultunense Esp]